MIQVTFERATAMHSEGDRGKSQRSWPGPVTGQECSTAPEAGSLGGKTLSPRGGGSRSLCSSPRGSGDGTLSHTGLGEPSPSGWDPENFPQNSLLNSAQVPRGPQASLPPGSLLTFIIPGREYKWRPTSHKSKYLTAKNQTLR